MFFYLPIFFQSLVFLLFLKLSSTIFAVDFFSFIFEKNFYIGIIIIFLILLYAIRAAHRISKRAVMTPLPLFFSLSALGLLYFISSPFQENIFILLSAGIYYFLLLGIYRLKSYEKDQTAIGILGASSVATIFFFYSSVYGIYLNFVFPLWALMLAFLFVTTLISFQYLWILKKDIRMVWSYSLVLGLIMTEIAWVLNFWPFGYLTTGVVALIFYYIFWDLVCMAFKATLTKKRVIQNMAYFVCLAFVVLLSSHWLPVV
jgi:hypothetical protein